MCDCLFAIKFLSKYYPKVEENLCLSTFLFSVMLNHHCTINMFCTIINFDSVAPTVLLIYTVRLLTLTVIPLSIRLKGPVRLFGTLEYLYPCFFPSFQKTRVDCLRIWHSF